MAPAVGFEPTTNGLTVRCATAAPRRISYLRRRCLAEGRRHRQINSPVEARAGIEPTYEDLQSSA